MKEQQTNGESWRSRIALRLKPPDTLPSGWGQLQREYSCQLVRHTLLGERSTLLCPKGACPDRPSDGAPCEPRPFATNCNDHQVLRIITGGCTIIAYVEVAHCCCFTL